MGDQEKESKDARIELSKSLLGCVGPVLAALVTGVFAVVTLFATHWLSSPAAAPTFAIAPPINPVLTIPATAGISASLSMAASPTVTRSANTFGNITFAAGMTASGKPVDPLSHFPEGVTRIVAVFPYDGIKPGTAWRAECYVDGKLKEELTTAELWDESGSGTYSLGIVRADGLSTGAWEMQLSVNSTVVQKGTFVVEKNAPGKPFFGPIKFAEGIADDLPVDPQPPNAKFRTGTSQVYAFFDAGYMTNGMAWRREWYRDGNLLPDYSKSLAWDGDESESDWWTKLSMVGALTPGTYELRLYIQDRLVQLGTFKIEQ